MDGLNQVARGVEGSGAAQVVNTLPLVQQYNKIKEDKLAQDMANMDKAQKAMEKIAKTLDIGGTPHHLDVDQYNGLREGLINDITTAMKSSDIDNPNSDAAKQLRKAKTLLGAIEKQSLKNGAAYDDALAAVGDFSKHDQLHLQEKLEAYRNATTIEEKSEIAGGFLKPVYNVNDDLLRVSEATVKNVYENTQGVTTTNIDPNKAAIKLSAQQVIMDDPGGWKFKAGKEQGLWSTQDEQLDYYVNSVVPNVSTTSSTTRVKPDDGGGFNINFPSGGGAMESKGWDILPYDIPVEYPSRTGAKAGTVDKALSIGYKGKGSPLVPLHTSEDGIRSGVITDIILDPKDPSNSDIVFKYYKADKLTGAFIEDGTPTKKLKANEANMGAIKRVMGLDINEAIKNLYGQDPVQDDGSRKKISAPNMTEKSQQKSAEELLLEEFN